MKPFYKSRKFLLLVLDAAIAIVGYAVGRYVAPEAAQDILVFVGLLQPVFVAVIVGIAVEDSAAIKQGLKAPVSSAQDEG